MWQQLQPKAYSAKTSYITQQICVQTTLVHPQNNKILL